MKRQTGGEHLYFLAAILLLILCTWGQGLLDRGETAQADTGISGETMAPQIALTFDDGPTIYTETLLEGLKERDVKASFFLLGRNIEGKEELVKTMYEDGHLIGNHTYNHVRLSKISREQAVEEIQSTSELIYEITGQYTSFIRPPYGEWSRELEYAVTMFPVLWSVDPLDWKTENADTVVQRVEKTVEEGDIILLHDGSESSVEAALRIIDDLTGEGYQFVTVEEMLLE